MVGLGGPVESAPDDRAVEGGDDRGVQDVVGQVGITVDVPAPEDLGLEGGLDLATERAGRDELGYVDVVLLAIPVVVAIEGGEVIDEGEAHVRVGVRGGDRVRDLLGVRHEERHPVRLLAERPGRVFGSAWVRARRSVVSVLSVVPLGRVVDPVVRRGFHYERYLDRRPRGETSARGRCGQRHLALPDRGGAQWRIVDTDRLGNCPDA